MQMADEKSGAGAVSTKDLVCGMTVDPATAQGGQKAWKSMSAPDVQNAELDLGIVQRGETNAQIPKVKITPDKGFDFDCVL